MAKAKATNKGTCQCCGSVQKLPGGRLSQHGYRVLWSEFVNVCDGADELPFELSCALVERYITLAVAQRERLVAFQAQLRDEAPTKPRGWLHEYASGYVGNRYHQGYAWREVELFENTRGIACYTDHAGRERWLDSCHTGYDYSAETLLEKAHAMNRVRAKALDKSIAEIDTYVAWQRGRIANWQPTELLPLK